MKKVLLLCSLILATSASTSLAGGILDPIGTGIDVSVNSGSSSSDHQGSSGSNYQYDMNNGSDRNSYSVDLDAQRRDQMYIGVGSMQDNLSGQNGGGIR